jgi:hypothetical protein
VADLAGGSLFSLFESAALSVGFDNVDPVSQAVEESSGELLGTEELCPVFKGEISSHHQALAFVGATDFPSYSEEGASSIEPRFGVLSQGRPQTRRACQTGREPIRTQEGDMP